MTLRHAILRGVRQSVRQGREAMPTTETPGLVPGVSPVDSRMGGIPPPRRRLSERADEDGPHEGECGARGNDVDLTHEFHG